MCVTQLVAVSYYNISDPERNYGSEIMYVMYVQRRRIQLNMDGEKARVYETLCKQGMY